MHDPVILPRAALVRDWKPAFPAGNLRAVVLHWTAGDYATVSTAYHFCLSGPADVSVHATHDLRANMRDVRAANAGAYAAHTFGRNSHAVGIAVCAMRSATPDNFGASPITRQQIAALCVVAAALVRCYGIAIAAVRTHAEAAVDDGYFGADDAGLRWDIARLEPSCEPLRATEAKTVGDLLRERVAALA